MAFHRANMRAYENHLLQSSYKVHYIECIHPHHDIRQLIPHLAKQGYTTLHFSDVTDNWLDKRIRETALQCQMEVEVTDSPSSSIPAKNCVNTTNAANVFQTDFYTWQRKYRSILIEADGKPSGGKWSFDADNRQRYPAKSKPPQLKNKAPNPSTSKPPPTSNPIFPTTPEKYRFITLPPAKKPCTGWMIFSLPALEILVPTKMPSSAKRPSSTTASCLP